MKKNYKILMLYYLKLKEKFPIIFFAGLRTIVEVRPHLFNNSNKNLPSSTCANTSVTAA
jgi:hypothetical protein